MIEAFALFFGQAVFALCGVTILCGLVLYASQCAWRVVKDAYSWAWLTRAIKAHQKVEPSNCKWWGL